jgi:4'-phosphopantetheinyl transferase
MDSTPPATPTATVDVASARPIRRAAVETLLSADECQRADRYRDADEMARFVTARALLRLMISSAVGTPPAELVFDSHCHSCGRPHGKPRPLLPAGAAPLGTSVSHAGDRILVVTSAVAVGVDVEALAAVGFDGFDGVALTPGERAQLEARPAPERDRARAEAWVQKEALLKLHEVGLGRNPPDLHLGLSSADRVLPDPVRPGYSVALVTVPVGRRYRAALAVRSTSIPRIRRIDGDRMLTAPRRAGDVAGRAT